MVIKQSVLVIDMLDAGEMGRNKDLSDFHKGQIVLARRLGQSISETTRLVGCSWSAVVRIYQQCPRRDKPQTGDRVLDGQDASMHEGNEDYPIWSEPTEGLLWHKPHKILMLVMGGMCHNQACHTSPEK